MGTDSEVYITVQEAANVVGCTHQTVLRAIHNGKIAAVWNEDNRSWALRLADVRNFQPQKQGRPIKC